MPTFCWRRHTTKPAPHLHQHTQEPTHSSPTKAGGTEESSEGVCLLGRAEPRPFQQLPQGQKSQLATWSDATKSKKAGKNTRRCELTPKSKS